LVELMNTAAVTISAAPPSVLPVGAMKDALRDYKEPAVNARRTALAVFASHTYSALLGRVGSVWLQSRFVICASSRPGLSGRAGV
jgi:hypothetical protein